MGSRPMPDPVAGKFSVTLEDDKRVWIGGCVSLLVYEDSRIVIRVRGRNITVSGSKLTLESYGERELCICGTIDLISLERRV